jgi:short-subunit dehydrogenase
MTETWVIVGASSAMARATTRRLAERGAGLILAGRDMDDLATNAADAHIRGAAFAEAMAIDLRDPKTFAEIYDRLLREDGSLNAAVFAGSMPQQAEIDANPSLIPGVVADSHTGPAEFLHGLAPMVEARGQGTIVGVSSVAGDRGRVGNYVYGSAKAGFATYLSGLRNRLHRSGAHVVTVKPGMIDTAMTWGLDGLVLLAGPDKVAGDIMRAVDKKRNVIYTPFPWRYIMFIIQHIPEFIFKKMSI